MSEERTAQQKLVEPHPWFRCIVAEIGSVLLRLDRRPVLLLKSPCFFRRFSCSFLCADTGHQYQYLMAAMVSKQRVPSVQLH